MARLSTTRKDLREEWKNSRREEVSKAWWNETKALVCILTVFFLIFYMAVACFSVRYMSVRSSVVAGWPAAAESVKYHMRCFS